MKNYLFSNKITRDFADFWGSYENFKAKTKTKDEGILKTLIESLDGVMELIGVDARILNCCAPFSFSVAYCRCKLGLIWRWRRR